MMITVRVYPRAGIKEDDVAERMFNISYGIESGNVSIDGEERKCWTVSPMQVEKFIEACRQWSISVEVFVIMGRSLVPWGSTVEDEQVRMLINTPLALVC